MDPNIHVTRFDISTSGGRWFTAIPSREEERQFIERVSAEMASLAAMTGETALLAVLDGSDVVCIADAVPRGGRSPGAERIPFWRRATGRVLAAGLPRETRRTLLEQTGDTSIAQTGSADRQAFAAHLDLISARGYAIDAGEFAVARSVLAAPIVDRDGRAIAALAIEGPDGRLPRQRLHELAPTLIEATRNASAHAGGVLRPVSKTPPPSVPPSTAVKVLSDTRNLIGECPVYDAVNDRLYWVDLYEPAIFRLDRPTRRLISFSPGEMVTALALRHDGLLAAAQSGLWLLDPETGERVRFLGHPEPLIPTNRPNDGKCDSRGRFWINTVGLDFAAGAGALYRLDPDGEFAAAESDLTIPNGIGWSPDDRTLYLADTAQRSIYAYDFSADVGQLSNRRTLVQIPDDAPGAPDGLAIDVHGDLWVAMFDGWRISRFSPSGKLLDEIVMPVPRPTSCAFGPDGILFVTTARIRVSEATLKQAPHSGAVFEVSL